MLMSRVQEPALIAGFYESAADPARWEPTWAAVCHAFDAPSGLLFHQPDMDTAPHILASMNWRGHAPIFYAGSREGGDVSPRHAAIDTRYRSIVGQEAVRPEFLQDNDEFDAMCNPSSDEAAFHVLGANVPLSGTARAGVGLQRPINEPAFGESDRAALDSVSLHLAAALRLSTQLLAERRASAMRGAALHGMRQGVVIADAEGTIVFSRWTRDL
jgi:hypothetical protein